jgi:hypothetical protein
MNQMLRADLSMINAAIKADSEISDPVKRHLGELVAWCEAHVDQTKELDDRVESAEAALTEIIEGDGEMVSQETAAIVISSSEHGLLLCQATLALLEGPMAASVDQVSKKRFKQLIENAQAAHNLSMQVINELIAEGDDEDEENDDGLGDDGLGDGDETEAGETEEADASDE